MASYLPRKFKTFLKIASLAFIILLMIALWYYRVKIFRGLNDPGQPFQTYIPPVGADYDLDEGWIARPDLGIDSELFEGDADIFVVTPTLYLGRQHWVSPIDDPEFNAQIERITTPNYVMPYDIAGRLFAPLYRQAALFSFFTNREDARLAQRLAYDDVRRAFDIFLSNHKPERPIVLIGHGQGGLHVNRLLFDYFDGDLANHLAAAYIIDHPTVLETLPATVPPCEAADSVNCVVGFGTFTPNDEVTAERFVTESLVFQPDGSLEVVRGRELLCVNPLLWTRDEDYAPARLHLGGIAAEGLGRDQIAVPARRQFGAQCEEGILIIDTPKERSLRRPIRFGGKFRTLHSNLFYEDLRQNILLRVQSLIDTDTLPRRAPLLQDEDIIDIEDVLITLPEN